MVPAAPPQNSCLQKMCTAHQPVKDGFVTAHIRMHLEGHVGLSLQLELIAERCECFCKGDAPCFFRILTTAA